MTVETHLSYPSQPSPSPLSSVAGPSGLSSFPSSGQQPRSRTLLKDRLYVGNLSHSVDEHALIQIFSKFGKLSNLDYLFHKSGPLKGKPRGYAFVEYVDPADAERALTKAHDKLLRGRRLVVTFAHQAPTDAFPGGGDRGYRRMVNEAGRPTALSLLKSAQEGGRDRTKDKIAIMEAKLRQLEK
ncbi:RNA-binding domain-containing protein, partial [Stereum hirsutum FP-91666 SS1]|uniref:RNA-binding domain-containing protein n=1 Tax=Stereum hirsutum (strain FP-91666) TaxID=721885 RepID=UPI000444A05D